jgi:hypothetical protein
MRSGVKSMSSTFGPNAAKHYIDEAGPADHSEKTGAAA